MHEVLIPITVEPLEEGGYLATSPAWEDLLAQGCTVADLIRKLRKAGFVFDRQAKGSHEIWYNGATQRCVVIPNHPGDVPKGTLRTIIQPAGLTIDEFVAL